MSELGEFGRCASKLQFTIVGMCSNTENPQAVNRHASQWCSESTTTVQFKTVARLFDTPPNVFVLNPLTARVVKLDSMSEGQPSEVSNGVDHAKIAPAEVRGALTRVLQSPEFRASRRSQDFLRYVVERTLDGQAESLKERTIGIDVFARSAEYDPSNDATVRVKAGEVRKRLGIYYATEGLHDDIRIDLPAGTYVPDFIRGELRAPVAAPKSIDIPAAAVLKPIWRTRALLLLGMVLAVGAAAALWINL